MFKILTKDKNGLYIESPKLYRRLGMMWVSEPKTVVFFRYNDLVKAY